MHNCHVQRKNPKKLKVHQYHCTNNERPVSGLSSSGNYPSGQRKSTHAFISAVLFTVTAAVQC